MKKLLTAGIFGTLLTITGGADASIVSRGFFEEQIGNYATLDLLNSKANQSDLTNLSNIVGTPTEMTYMNLSFDRDMYELFGETYWQQYGDTAVPTNDISEFIRLSYTDTTFPGIAGILVRLFATQQRDDENWPIRLFTIFDDYSDLYRNSGGTYFYEYITDGGNSSSGIVYGLRKLTNEVKKIGTLPAGYDSVGAALEAINAKVDNKITNLSATASNGKYVLTAVKEGDQTTYAWESI
ncbi:MAG: hypothetical protein IJN91_00310, partial [Alphaproteobacteria bacterium]|nr:hypothetical protein [Alphaproteobacteria bacterium]